MAFTFVRDLSAGERKVRRDRAAGAVSRDPDPGRTGRFGPTAYAMGGRSSWRERRRAGRNGEADRMSRSIHATYRSLARLRRQDFSDTQASAEAVVREETALRRKQRIKLQVWSERHASVVPAPGVRLPAGEIPIRASDESAHVYHAASARDVRAVLEALPAEAVAGIDEVRLMLGREYMLEREDEASGSGEPFTGRPGSRMFSGVYGGRILGTYFSASGRICLYAYVVDWKRVFAPRMIVELFLRLRALKTLVHEVAHFHDHVARVSRGRWLADRHENNEWYAEKREHEWTEKIVLPVLHRLYPRECRIFRAWVRQRGGADLPIDFFAGDERRTRRDGLTRLVSPTSDVIESWMDELPTCSSRQAASLSLAWRLHYSDCYAECLALVDRLIVEDPAHIGARECRIDTLVHLERFDEVLAEADAIHRLSPGSEPAWEARADVYEERKDWPGLLEVCARWLPAAGRSPRNRRQCLLYQAVAQCASGDEPGMAASLSAYANTFRGRPSHVVERRMEIRRRWVLRRAGNIGAC